MKKIFILLAFCLLNSAWAEDAPIQALIRVKDTNDKRCQRYFQFQDLLLCSTEIPPPFLTPHLKDLEKQMIAFGDQHWRVVGGGEHNGTVAIEYVPDKDDIQHWHELVTSQFISGFTNLSPKAYALKVLQGISEAGFSPSKRFYGENSDHIIFEFQIAAPLEQQQDEIQKITKTKSGFAILHYVIKEPDMSDENRERWLAILKASSLNAA